MGTSYFSVHAYLACFLIAFGVPFVWGRFVVEWGWHRGKKGRIVACVWCVKMVKTINVKQTIFLSEQERRGEEEVGVEARV